ncbi:MAG: hypothetical protein EOP10_27000 [Proteobacteria bacterium]|nr:MAG: hypothetical protein EOP10_27000 [Pseudomonadota bacterium]
MKLFTGDYTEQLGPGNFCYEDNVLLKNSSLHLSLQALENSSGFLVPYTLIKDIPAVEWKLVEAYKRRSQAIHKLQKINSSAA